ncbi:hypothetical protein Tco_0609386 [Tanacetum coccineum]
MDSLHSTLSMYYDYGAHVKGELLVMMKNFQSVNLLIFISNTLIELFNDFGFDCDGIPKRPTMYLKLWSYKVVRHRYLNPMIQPELEGSTQGYPLISVEVLRFDTSAGNPVKEILLKLSLPDHRSILTDSKVTPTNHGRMTKPYSSPRFIANCFNAGYLKMVVKRQSVKVKEIQERCISKAFQDYEIKKGMSMSVQMSLVHEMAKSTRWRYKIMRGDDLKKLNDHIHVKTKELAQIQSL